MAYATIGQHKTVVYKNDEGVTCVRYHETDVVKFNKNFIFLDTGGWFTATTKTRMNQASRQFDLGFTIYQKKGDWYCDFFGSTWMFGDNTMALMR